MHTKRDWGAGGLPQHSDPSKSTHGLSHPSIITPTVVRATLVSINAFGSFSHFYATARFSVSPLYKPLIDFFAPTRNVKVTTQISLDKFHLLSLRSPFGCAFLALYADPQRTLWFFWDCFNHGSITQLSNFIEIFTHSFTKLQHIDTFFSLTKQHRLPEISLSVFDPTQSISPDARGSKAFLNDFEGKVAVHRRWKFVCEQAPFKRRMGKKAG